MNNKICAGIIAQVDAGKTTLCESILYSANVIRRKGRVDFGNSFFDFNAEEIDHGITVFSKEATIEWNNTEISIIDTPGHRDFRSEVDRIIPVIDILVFVVSAPEISKPQNQYVFHQLASYNKPIIIFISKMDMGRVLSSDIKRYLSSAYSDKCVTFSAGSFDLEAAAIIDEPFYNAYFSGTPVSEQYTCASIKNRIIYPVIYGSGLTGDGVEEMLNLLSILADTYQNAANSILKEAYVYKIDRDSKGLRQTHVRVISGSFSVREAVSFSKGEETVSEKIPEIRKICGSRFACLPIAFAGDVVVFTGISFSCAGMIISCKSSNVPISSTLGSRIAYSVSCASPELKNKLFDAIKVLEEEDPELAFSIATYPRESISVHLLGELHKEHLIDLFQKRFSIPVTLENPHVDYYETISNTVYGNGHYEPLRHYAEVRVELSPLPNGSGVIVESRCPGELLSLNWQNTVLNYLRSTQIRGVISGSPITDVKITLINGKSHIKHTEGGDFREAAIRAVRQGLMKAKSILLEPYASFIIICSTSLSGKMLSELDAKHISVQKQIVNSDSQFEISGKGPLILIDNMRRDCLAKRGEAVFFEYETIGLFPCLSSDQIISALRYDAQADINQSPDSVFCSHGAGHVIKWDEADQYMHTVPTEKRKCSDTVSYALTETELHEILKKNSLLEKNPIIYRSRPLPSEPMKHYSPSPLFYLIDGSNLLYTYISLNYNSEDASDRLFAYKSSLISDLINYLKFIGASAHIVFDGKVSEDSLPGEYDLGNNLSIVYSGHESADVVLERLASEVGPEYNCKMVSSDRLIQISAFHSGITRLSSREFVEEMNLGISTMRQHIKQHNMEIHHSIGDSM